MSKELANRVAGLSVTTVDDLARVADMMAKSGYFPDARSAAQAGVKIMAGAGWGIQPFDAMTGIHVIEGKPSVGAGLMAARVKSSEKYDYRVREMSDTACRIEFFEGRESAGVSEFTIEDAKAAGVAFKTSKGFATTWAKFPRNMLFARALSNGVRWFCPDVFSTPVYVPEELGASVDGEGNVVDVPSRPTPTPQPQPGPEPEPEPEPDPEPEPEGGLPFAAISDDDAEPLPELDEGEEELITPSQLRAVHTRLTKLGFTSSQDDKDTARAFIGHLVGRELESSKDLTKNEASALLDTDDAALDAALNAFSTGAGGVA